MSGHGDGLAGNCAGQETVQGWSVRRCLARPGAGWAGRGNGCLARWGVGREGQASCIVVSECRGLQRISCYLGRDKT